MLEMLSISLMAVYLAVKCINFLKTYYERLYDSAMNGSFLADYSTPNAIPDTIFFVPALIILMILLVSSLSGKK